MIHRTTYLFPRLLLSGLSLSAITLAPIARADVVLRAEAPLPPNESVAVYPLEIEPHLAFGPENVYGDSGYGAGIRFGIPVAFGHLGSVPHNLAIGLGADFLNYCTPPSDFGLLPTVAVGGRFHFGGSTALTLRLGYPTTTLGVSFL
jgi:hypothetical protein